MLRRRNLAKTDEVKISFVLPADDPRLPASVVGDFNEWDPETHPMRRRANGTFSATVTLRRGGQYAFRYRGADGHWFNDDDADGFVPNEFAGANCLLNT
jgi:1,4-alpha-glucan branching enzyme